MQWGSRRCALDPFAGGELGEVSRCCGLALDEHCGGDRVVVAAGNWLEDLLFQHLSELGDDGVVGGVPEGCDCLVRGRVAGVA
jgi:hypothetical protein